MEEKKTYSELLKDPRWQRKRLEIMNRDNFTCQICGHKDYTLHVHHIAYKKNIKPWECDNNNLITLCENCHHSEHEAMSRILENINFLKESGALMIEIEAVTDLICLCLGPWRRPDVIIKMLKSIDDDDKIDFSQDYWGLDCPESLCARLAEWRKYIGNKHE